MPADRFVRRDGPQGSLDYETSPSQSPSPPRREISMDEIYAGRFTVSCFLFMFFCFPVLRVAGLENLASSARIGAQRWLFDSSLSEVELQN